MYGRVGAKPEVLVESSGWFHVCVRNAILAQNIYCAKPNTEPDTHFGSWIRNVIGDWAPQSILKYNRATTIVVQPLTHTVAFKMGLSSFAAMSQLKVAITTSAYLPILSSTEMTNG